MILTLEMHTILFFSILYVCTHAYCVLHRHETKLIVIGGVLRIVTSAFNFGGVVTFIFGTTFLVYAGSGGELSAQRVFTTLALVDLLRRISVTLIVHCFFLLYEASVANSRIQVCFVFSWVHVVLVLLLTFPGVLLSQVLIV